MCRSFWLALAFQGSRLYTVCTSKVDRAMRSLLLVGHSFFLYGWNGSTVSFWSLRVPTIITPKQGNSLVRI